MPSMFKVTFKKTKKTGLFSCLVHLEQVAATAIKWNFRLKDSLAILGAWLVVPNYFRKASNFCALRQMASQTEMKQQK